MSNSKFNHFEEDGNNDPVFDVLLEEAVTGRRPPNLLGRITAAWQIEHAAEIPLPNPTEAKGTLVAPPVAAPVATVRQPAKEPAARASSSQAWKVLLVLAASGLLIACGLQLRQAFFADKSGVAQNKPLEKDLPHPESKETSLATKSPELIVAPNTKASVTSEQLALESVPFRKVPDAEPAVTGVASASGQPANRLSDQQIVELIDTQLAALWTRLQVKPAESLDEVQLAQSLSRVLTGQELPVGSIEKMAELKPRERREAVIAQALDSQAFARKWANQLVANWLGGGNLPRDNSAVKRLEEFVASSIAGDRPWNEVVANALSGKTPAGDVFVSAFAGGGNHRMAAHLSGSFLDGTLACVRCHERKGPAVAGASSQEQYWSVVAMLTGLDVQAKEKSEERLVVDRQAELFAANKQPNLFFDRPDGTLEAAKFVLPDGKPWQSVPGAETPRAALARWIGDSSQSDAAIVNQVWQIAFNRPLVPSNSLVDDVGFADRIELQQLLAQQFRAHGRNLTQLVNWVVRAEAFGKSALPIDRVRWLQASETEIAGWHQAEMAFAARSSLSDSNRGADIAKSLTSVIKWNQPNDSGSTILAQPSLDLRTKSKQLVQDDKTSMPAVGYVVHRGQLSEMQQSYLKQLAASEKLTWEEKLAHVVGLAPGQSLNGDVKRLSDELLKSLNDPNAVLVELLWAVQACSAG